MTQKERRQLIELGILTEDCGPSTAYWKLSPQLKRGSQTTHEREGAYDWWTSSDQDLRAAKRSLKKERRNKNDRKGKTTISDRVGNMEAGASTGTRTKGEGEEAYFRRPC
jgi:hypothetical protein